MVLTDSQKSFAKIPDLITAPNLIELQVNSYNWFKTVGISKLLKELSPIVDFTGSKYNLYLYDSEGIVIERDPKEGIENPDNVPSFKERLIGRISKEKVTYPKNNKILLSENEVISEEKVDEIVSSKIKEIKVLNHYFKENKNSEVEAREREITYSAQLFVYCTLFVNIKDDDGNVTHQEPIRKEIFFGDIPLMTRFGTFIINGAERVVVSQLVRSPGVYFTKSIEAAMKKVTQAKVIPYRGVWLEFETSARNTLAIKVDRKRKVPATTILKILGITSDKDLINIFKDTDQSNMIKTTMDRNSVYNVDVLSKVSSQDLRKVWETIFGEADFDKEKSTIIAASLIEFYRRMRPGELANLDNALSLFKSLFLDNRRYDLEDVGRYKINSRLDNNSKNNSRTLTIDDFIGIINILLNLHNGNEPQDDIDHLGNRRVRSVGELLQNQMRIGLLRTERMAKERMTMIEEEEVSPQSLINIRPMVAAIKEFFGGSQLSQFMDQVNPLADLTHKRRLSALGPGGLSRDRAGFDVRDVHFSHYGRICPIETPEGPNFGLLSSLATFGRINEFGFIESPYRKIIKTLKNGDENLIGRKSAQDVFDGKKLLIKQDSTITRKKFESLTKTKINEIQVYPFVSDNKSEVVFLSADKEQNFKITHANEILDKKGQFVNSRIEVRIGETPTLVNADEVEYMDVSPMQIVSVSAALIPFLEHDDANRALMGSNMQRQAVPLINPEAPIVGTGIESKVAEDSGQVITSPINGLVESSCSDKVVVKDGSNKLHSFDLTKFNRTNQGTCFNQRPSVDKGQVVEEGTVLADSTSSDNGKLALGKNLLVAFMSWEGYNYEDAIIISENLVKNDVLTSVHIGKYEVEARETKLGVEEITDDIPNVSEENLANLDEKGIIRIGAEVSPGDILVGKITPKGETELGSEEKLLRAIFGEKSRDVKDNSLRVPHGESGKVIKVKVLTKENGDELSPGVLMSVRVWIAKTRKISVGDKMAGRHGNKGVIARILPVEAMPHLPDGTPIDLILNPIGVPSRMNLGQLFETHLGRAAKILDLNTDSPVFDGARYTDIETYLGLAWLSEKLEKNNSVQNGTYSSKNNETSLLENFLEEKGLDIEGIIKGDKGNELRNIVKKMWLEEHNVDLSNIADDDLDGLIGETETKYKDSNPILGKTKLIDGRTGQFFEQPVTVGYTYMMKLSHLVDDKIHARSTGPYSLITQQPLGGKAQFGGQRLGEMEVWALEGYSAAYNLQEMLTVKSDDVTGRVRTYESIIKGEELGSPGIPESFNVLIKELQSLGLSVELLRDKQKQLEAELEEARELEAENEVSAEETTEVENEVSTEETTETENEVSTEESTEADDKKSAE